MDAHGVVSRRTFLQLAGMSAGLTVLAQLRLPPGLAAETAASDAALQTLSTRDAALFGAIAERLTFTGDATMPRFGDSGALRTVDAALQFVAEDVREQLHWALRLFEYGPPVFTWRVSTFTGLGAAEQDHYLETWAHSGFALCRQAFDAFKNLAFLGYYAQDATWKGLHYDGPWVPRPRKSLAEW